MKFKDELLKLKPWLILIGFAGIVALIVMNFAEVIHTTGRLLSYLTVFFYGLMMAYIINIPMSIIERNLKKHLDDKNFFNKHSRGISLFLAVLLVVFIVVLLFSIIVPEILNSIIRIIGNLGVYFNSLIGNIATFLSYLNVDIESLSQLDLESFLANFGINYADILQRITDIVVGTGAGTITQLFNIGSFFFNLFMGFFICLYLLGSKEMFIRQAKKVIVSLLPNNAAKKSLRVFSVTNEIFKEFIGGKLIEMVIVWIMMYVALKVFAIQYATLIASLCAVVVLIPYFGALVVTIIAVVLLLSVDPLDALIFFVIYQVVQNIDGNIIYPKIMGNATGLPAVWILVSVFFFGGLMGPFGMLVAVPLTACIYIFISEIIRERLEEKKVDITEYTTDADI